MDTEQETNPWLEIFHNFNLEKSKALPKCYLLAQGNAAMI
jgi:hypothetical protein